MQFQKSNPEAELPVRQSSGSAGYDLYAAADALITAVTLVSTGVKVKIPDNHVGLIRDRSGLAAKHGITVLAGVIDADYTGELKVVLSNVTTTPFEVHKGDRIAQLVVMPCVMTPSIWVDSLAETQRGEGGFGSTNK